MTEQEYKRSYKDDDDAAKLFREDEPIRCKLCGERIIKELEPRICEYCFKDQYFIEDNEN